MKIRLAKKLFYKESAEWLLNEGCVYAYINPRIVKQVVRKLEKLTKLKLIYYLYSEFEEDCFVIRKKITKKEQNKTIIFKNKKIFYVVYHQISTYTL